jgi:hypothetical protein
MELTERMPAPHAGERRADSWIGSAVGYPIRLSLTRKPSQAKQQKVEANMRLGSVILVIWLIIGLIATGQRGYFNDRVSCASAGTVIVTILAGPLNYVGVNPKLSCH